MLSSHKLCQKNDRIIRLCPIVFFYNNVEVNLSLPVYYFEIPMSRPKVLNIYYTICYI